VRRVLVGSLQDNPGTAVVNATEEIGAALSELLFDSAGSSAFTMFEYDPRGLPTLAPTAFRVVWHGERDRFAMPTLEVVEPADDPELGSLLAKVRDDDYTLDRLLVERDLIHIVSPEIERRASRPKAPRTVAPEEFRAQFAPTYDDIKAFTDVVTEMASASYYPNVNSVAMAELAAEQEVRDKTSWQHPVVDTHALGGITLRAAADHVQTFAEVFAADRVPLYGHLVLARAAFEASVVAAWLNEPGTSYLDRIKRGMCELLLSAKEQTELDVDNEAHARLAECLSDGRKHIVYR